MWEGSPNRENIKLGLLSRDEEMEIVWQMLRNRGEVGIPVWCSI